VRALMLQHAALVPPGIWAEALDDAGVEIEIVRPDVDGVPGDLHENDLLVVLGGPQSAREEAAPAWLVDEIEAVGTAVRAGTPFLGVCLGAQVLARALGGSCVLGPAFELGLIDVLPGRRWERDPVFGPMSSGLTAFAFHGDAFTLPAGAQALASSPGCLHEVMRCGPSAYGLQFHLEVSLDDVAVWLDHAPAGAADRLGPGGREGFLERYAAAVPALRDAAVGIAQRWLAGAARSAWPSPPVAGFA
jgi:GMP synthase-like glutamine amidotransferase